METIKEAQMEIFICSINDKDFLLETDPNVFLDDIIKLFMKEYKYIDKQMEGSRFSFKFAGSLSVTCHKVNEPKASLYIKSPKWLRYKNSTINPENIDDRCFQYSFALTHYHKEVKNHPEHMSNITPFLSLYNSSGIEYPTVIDKNNYALFEKVNLEIALIVFYINVKIAIVKLGKNGHAVLHNSIKQLYVSNQYYEKKKKRQFCY